MDVSGNVEMPALSLDAAARDILGEATSGVSVGGGRSRIHLLDAGALNRQRATKILSNFGALQLSASATNLDQGAADPVIRCRDSAISGDSELGYLVTLDGEVYATGNDIVATGEVSLTLSRPEAGEYAVFVWRKRGNFASAILHITVNEV